MTAKRIARWMTVLRSRTGRLIAWARSRTSDALAWAGAAMVAAGMWRFHPGLGLITGGLFLLAFGFLLGIPRKGRQS